MEGEGAERGLPAMGLGLAFYRPKVGRMSTRNDRGLSLTEGEGNSATVVASPRRPARWRGGRCLEQRGVRQWCQAEAVEGRWEPCVRRVELLEAAGWRICGGGGGAELRAC